MEKEYMSETAPVSEETEMPAVRERRARRVPQRFPSMTSAPSAPAEQETGEDTAQAVPATVPEAVQAEEIAAAAGAEEDPTEVSDADASAKTAAPDEAALLAEDAFVPLVEIPTEEPRVEQQAAAVPTAQDNSTVQKERVRRVRTYRPIVFSRKAAIIFPIVFALLITGALLWRTVGGERYEAVMLYINDREIGYIADASQADTQYARLTSELQGKTEAAFVPEVSYTCRDVVSYTDPSATALDEDEIYYAMLSNAMAGYRMGYIVEINGAAVAFVDTAETVENARRAAEEKYRERFSDALPENVRIIANESFKIVYGFGRQTDVMDEGALYSMFLTSFSFCFSETNVTACSCRQLHIRQGGVVSCADGFFSGIPPSIPSNHPSSSMVIGRTSSSCACSFPFGTVPVSPSICQKFHTMTLATVFSSCSVGFRCHRCSKYSTKVSNTLIRAISRLSP